MLAEIQIVRGGTFRHCQHFVQTSMQNVSRSRDADGIITRNPLLNPQVGSVIEILAAVGDIRSEAHALATVAQADGAREIADLVAVLD